MRLTDVHLLMLFCLPCLDQQKLVGVLFGIIVVIADASVLGTYSVKHAFGFHSFNKSLSLAGVADEFYINSKHFFSLKLRKNICGICVGLYFGHYLFDIAVLVNDEGRADYAESDLSVLLLLLPYTVSLDGNAVGVG